jgi:hypothetical protein
VDWQQYEVVVIRSTWDYQQDPQAFLACLEQIEQQNQLTNSVNTVRWNINKRYLRDLETSGVGIVPTIWCDQYQLAHSQSAYTQFDCDEIVIKPNISAGAENTFRLTPSELAKKRDLLEQRFAGREHMIQPFLKDILTIGEFSLFYFNNQYSHTIVKRPKTGDFRVQEEHGGILKLVQPQPELLRAAEQCLESLPDLTLYARLDFVQYRGRFLVAEAELIEPSLYFNMDETAADRFAQAFDDRFSVLQ